MIYRIRYNNIISNEIYTETTIDNLYEFIDKLYMYEPNCLSLSYEPKFLAIKNEKKNKNLNIDCSICLNNLIQTKRKLVSTKCLHYFHKTCLKKWINENTNCPLCRAVL